MNLKLLLMGLAIVCGTTVQQATYHASETNQSETKQELMTKSAVVTGVDSSASTISSNGDFNIDIKITGTNLDAVENVRLYYRADNDGTYTTIKSSNFESDSSDTTIHVKKTFTQSTYFVESAFGKEHKLRYELDAGLATSTGIRDVMTTSTSDQTVTNDGYVSTLSQEDGVQTVKVSTDTMEITSVDSSATTINSDGDFDVDLKVSGENLDQIQNLRIYYRESGSEAHVTIPKTSFESATSTSIQIKTTLGKSALTTMSAYGVEQSLSYQVNVGLDTESAIAPITSASDNSDEVEKDGQISSLGRKSDTTQTMKVSPDKIVIDTVDSSASKITSAGDFDIDLVIKGSGLESADNVRFYSNDSNDGMYTTVSKSNFESDSTDTSLHVKKTFQREYQANDDILDKAQTLRFEVNAGEETSTGIQAVKTSTDNSDEVVVDDMVSSLGVTSDNIQTLKVSMSEATIDSIDSSASTLTSNGDFNIDLKIYGSNLNAISNVRLYASDVTNSYSTIQRSNFISDSTDEMIHVKLTFEKELYTKEETIDRLNQIQYEVDAGLESSTGRQSVKTVADNSAEQLTDLYISKLAVDADQNQKAQVSPVDVEPVITFADSSATKLASNGDVLVDFKLFGTNLDSIENVRLFASDLSNSYSTIQKSSFISDSTDEMIHVKLTFQRGLYTKDETYNKVNQLQYQVNAGLANEGERTAMPTLTDNSDTVKVDDYTTELMADSDLQKVKVYESKDLAVVDQTTVPTYSKDEEVSVDKLIADAGIVYTGDEPISATGSVDTSVVGDSLTANVTFSEGSGDEEEVTKAITYNVTTDNVSLTVSDQLVIPTYTQGETVTADDLVTDAGISATGDLDIAITGTVNTSTIGNGLSANVTFTEGSGDEETLNKTVFYNVEKANVPLVVGTQTGAVPTYTQDQVVTAQQLIEDAGITYSGDEPIIITGTVDTSTIGTMIATITFTEGSGDLESKEITVVYQVEEAPVEYIDLTASEQVNIPVYTQDQVVTAQQLIEDAGITYSGDEPITITGTVNTAGVGAEQPAIITLTEGGGDRQSKDLIVKYGVTEGDVDLIVNDQTSVPTYSQNQEVTAEQLVEDAGVTMSGDTVSVSGVVDTSIVGDNLTATINFVETAGDMESTTANVTYNVISSSTGEIVSAIQAGDNSATVKYQYNGSLENATLSVWNGSSKLGEANINAETGEGYGYQVFNNLPTNTELVFKLYDGDTLLSEYKLILTGVFVASNYFDVYANDGDIRNFNGDNEIYLTDKTYDNKKNRGAYSKYQIDTSQPFVFNGFYQCDSLTFPTASGKAIAFYQSKDGHRDHAGDYSEALGLLENGSPYAENGIAVALDSYGKDDSWGNGTQQVEVIDMSQGTGSNEDANPYELYTNNDGIDNKAIFWMKDWATWDIEWTPYADTTTFSGNLHVKVAIKYGDGNIEFDYQVPNDVFPQGYYWMKMDATTPEAGEFVSPSEMSIKIDDISAAWVY